ncbi:unnamed protein product [Closterium sp. NIES-65]|nr:unnamed protein product [Closterium sp. NIES-65]
MLRATLFLFVPLPSLRFTRQLFNKLLVANRGEIACRILRTAKKLGIPTVAVYSDTDIEAPHVRLADEAVHVVRPSSLASRPSSPPLLPRPSSLVSRRSYISRPENSDISDVSIIQYCGPSPANESYRNVERVMDAVIKAGADAVHPGYSFLSEKPEFAEKLKAQGVTFVGPTPEVMRLMKDKTASKHAAVAAGLQVLPIGDAVASDEDHAVQLVTDYDASCHVVNPSAAVPPRCTVPATPIARQPPHCAPPPCLTANKVGFPVVLKSLDRNQSHVLRIASNAREVRDHYDQFQQDLSFVSPGAHSQVVVEHYLEKARLIEIQIVADKHGGMLWFPEREASIQRRYQKSPPRSCCHRYLLLTPHFPNPLPPPVPPLPPPRPPTRHRLWGGEQLIDESPSTFVDAATRKALVEQSVALARSINYDTTGTVEFLLSQSKDIYFRGMSTRLHAGHAGHVASECVTGVDIVELMLRAAAGQKLAVPQDRIAEPKGWAIGARIYSDNPRKNFLPYVQPLLALSSGKILRYIEPAMQCSNEGILRIDSGVSEGDVINFYYHPLMSKVTTWAPTRDAAIDKMEFALDRYYIEGIESNIPFLRCIVSHPAFASGNITTNFIQDNFPAGFYNDHLSPREESELAGISAFLHVIKGVRASATVTSDRPAADATAAAAAATLSQKAVTEKLVVSVDGQQVPVTLTHWPSDKHPVLRRAKVDVAGEVMEVEERDPILSGKGLIHMSLDGKDTSVCIRQELPRGFSMLYHGSIKVTGCSCSPNPSLTIPSFERPLQNCPLSFLPWTTSHTLFLASHSSHACPCVAPLSLPWVAYEQDEVLVQRADLAPLQKFMPKKKTDDVAHVRPHPLPTAHCCLSPVPSLLACINRLFFTSSLQCPPHSSHHCRPNLTPSLVWAPLCVQLIRTPMPGSVVKISVRYKQKVLPGDELVTIEAMKMRNVIRAEEAGVIRGIYVKEGQTVKVGEMLLDLDV